MSLILDALKKAEQDRHAGQAPVLDEMLVRPTRVVHRRAQQQQQDLLLVVAIAAAVLFAAAGIAYWLWPSTPTTAPEQQTSAPAAVDSSPAQATSAEPVPALRIDPERLQAPLADVPEAQVDLADTGASEASTMEDLEGDSRQRTRRIPASAELQSEPPASIIAAPTAAESSATPLKQMPPSFRNELPKLVVDVHVYDENPLRRFVLVNGKKYRESDTLLDGPRVVEITPDGVIIEHRGSQVLLELPH